MDKNSSNIPIIRTMNTKDLGRIVEIDAMVFGKLRPEYWEMKLDLVKKRSPIGSLVAEIDAEVVGFVFGDASGWEYGVPENEGWVDIIAVDPAFQRKGIAQMLMQEMVDQLKKVGVDTIHTFVNWRDWNLLKFFDSVGFSNGEMINLKLEIK